MLLYNVPVSYDALWWNDDGIQRLTVAEEQSIYRADYTHIGATAARKWNFPPPRTIDSLSRDARAVSR
jgi:hypothetical protein